MSGWPWNEVAHAWAPGLTDARSGGGMPLRTVYNPRPQPHEEIPLTPFQQLPRQGEIEETEGQRPYDGHRQRIYRLV